MSGEITWGIAIIAGLLGLIAWYLNKILTILHLQSTYKQDDRHIEYELVVCHPDDLEYFVKKVREMIHEGWRPQGGVSHRANGVFTQTMTRTLYKQW